ncbi:hypothetical protein G6F57_000072 [Rhizopus arrhizus]|uniref:K Homology domain-containing protein n=1 Tax=Rhizopus oryzae TaxID=64495 RepID=A0A9P6XKU9_RHIOR|nr:hypothetical protein G6F23_004990 [Rhizopus arrhizus]KAG1415752.1 hypothetical protein G6F58_006332 [Rhizopus delemar]KAG0770601.1 hypothetical protein G6F24_000059 [Rhizopus arrhizus]KAG0794415.1 hypothetical protein G6F21_002886 [Rhizopus arrhizus]KAG0819612.1 hypothetical protein G6F20_000623 [Rhizopus arrhizus]
MTCAFSFYFGQVNTLPTSLTCQITVEGTNLTLTGQKEDVMATRTELLNLYPTQIHLNIKIPDQDCNQLRTACDKIAKETETTIALTEPLPQSSFTSQNTVNILITGIPDQAEKARINILVMLDKQSQLNVDTLDIPYKLHPLICGRKRTGLQSILEGTTTLVYFPSPFRYNDNDDSLIYVSGDQVERVKESLINLANEKMKDIHQKEAVLHPRKLDWMLLHKRNDIKKIMRDNASFIQFPKMGTESNQIIVYAENQVNVERTLRSLHFLACGVYEACFYFNHRDIYGVENASTFLPNISSLVSQLSQISLADVTYLPEPSRIEVYGTERAVRNVYQRLHDMAFLKMFHQSTVFNVELSNDQREFISGKKSGKINKIMKTSGAKIKFIPFSEYNFIIEVESSSFTKALDGLTLLQEELPAEISFYVPEVYHKRIIGVGGKNIQRIMKKYGVYVKFSNAEEFAALGGYYDNEDNVVARTPMKNQVNLDNLRHAVMDLINPKDRECVEQVLDVPFWLHRTLIGSQADFLTEVAKKTGTYPMWPDAELASDTLTLVGPESQIELGVQMVRSILPEEYKLYIPYSAQLIPVLSSESFQKDVVQRMSKEYRIEIECIPTTETKRNEIVKFKTVKGNMDALAMALKITTDYLKDQQITLYEGSAIVHHSTLDHSATPSVMPPNTATSFHVFDSKILPPSSTMASDLVSPTASSSSSLLNDFQSVLNGNNSNGLKSYSLFDYPTTTTGSALDASWRNFRDMNSSRTADNIRAIFDSPAERGPPPPSLFRGAPPTSPPNGLDIWGTNHPMNGFVNSPPMTGQMEGKPQSMMYANNNTNQTIGFYPLNSNSSTNKPNDFNTYIMPTSSTSTGSNNSSMHSSQSMPDIMLEERQHTGTLPTLQNYIHTQSPPLLYPSSTASHHNKPISAFLSSSASTPTTRGNHYPALFSQNHSFNDETVLVQKLFNSMSISQSSHLTH